MLSPGGAPGPPSCIPPPLHSFCPHLPCDPPPGSAPHIHTGKLRFAVLANSVSTVAGWRHQKLRSANPGLSVGEEGAGTRRVRSNLQSPAPIQLASSGCPFIHKATANFSVHMCDHTCAPKKLAARPRPIAPLASSPTGPCPAKITKFQFASFVLFSV